MAILTLMFGRDVLATYEVDRETFIVGRASDCDIVIDNLNVSRHHAKISKQDGVYYLTDLRSNNGTFLNGKRLKEGDEPLTFGDEIGIGKHALRFQSHSRLGRAEQSIPGNGPAPQAVMEADDSGTVVVNAAQLAAMQQKGSLVRRAHLRVDGVPVRSPIVELQDAEVRIGRDPASHVRVPGVLVGRTHCVISRRADGYYLEQVGGLRSPRVNGARTREGLLADGDVIELGAARLTFHDGRAG